MIKEMRFLIFEGLSADADAAIRELCEAGFIFKHRRVKTGEEFPAALREFDPNFVLISANLSASVATAAIRLLDQHKKRTPYIFYSDIDAVENAVQPPVEGFESFYPAASGVKQLPSAILDVLDKMSGAAESDDKIRSEEESYRLFFDSNPLPMWAYDLDTLKFLAVNEKAVGAYGYAREEFFGMTVKDIRPPEDIPLLLEQVAQPSSDAGRRVRHRKKDGTVIEVEIAGQPIVLAGRRARLVTVTDIKHRQPTDETWLRALNALNATRDGVFIFDSETLRFFYVNRGAVEQTGYSDAELLEMTPLDINPEFDEKSFRRMISPLIDGTLDSHFFTTVYRHKEGRDIPVEIILQHIASSDGENLFVAMVRDTRERKQAEAALSEANERALREYDCLLQRLAVLAQASGSARDLTTIFQAILDFALASVPCSALFISLYDPDKSTRQVVYFWYNGKEIDVSTLEPARVGEGPAGQTIRAGEVMIFGDYAKSVKRKPTHIMFGYDEDSREPRSTVMAPMKIKGQVIGLIEVQSYDLNAYAQEHTTALRMAANLAANAIENVRLLEQERINAERIRISQKMESLGQLAAGVAHEINTPLQYVSDNTRFLKDAFGDLSLLFDKYESILQESLSRLASQSAGSLNAKEKDNCQYLLKEIPTAIEESLEGIDRVSRIVQSMRDFAHPGSVEMKSVDLNRSIESTVTVARNEWKYIAEMEMDFDESLPPVVCIAGEINQVVLNLIINATHAIADVISDAGSQQKGLIKVKTMRDGEWVEIQVSDSGKGIPPEIQNRIFDPFFTTKEVGVGTGQGLAISHQVVVVKHGGSLSFRTKPESGTIFIIRIPIQGLMAQMTATPEIEPAAA